MFKIEKYIKKGFPFILIQYFSYLKLAKDTQNKEYEFLWIENDIGYSTKITSDVFMDLIRKYKIPILHRNKEGVIYGTEEYKNRHKIIPIKYED
jgi:hypothetical protein